MPHADPEVRKAFMQAYQRDYVAKRRARHLKAMGGKCQSCGSSNNLDVDHINPETKISHRIWSWSAKRIEEELSKCQLLCRNCHSQKTTVENYPARQHGTMLMYQKQLCRCGPCRAANAERERLRRCKKSLCRTSPEVLSDAGAVPAISTTMGMNSFDGMRTVDLQRESRLP